MPKLVERAFMLSMEIFCASRLEASDRAIFLSMVSAIEPLAITENLGHEVDSFVDDCLNRLEEYQEISIENRQSLRGRLNGLKKESIRQSVRRLIRTKIPEDPEAPAIIDKAYDLRSQLIHEGAPHDLDIEFATEAQKVSSILKKVYAKELGLSLDGR